MHSYTWPFKILMIIALMALTACSATATPTATFQRVTRVPLTPTETAAASTPTPTDTPAPTDTPTPAPTQPPTATVDPAVAALGCTAGEFAGNITYFDGTRVGPGHPFQKSWLIRNTGTCTWTTGYTLIYVNGTRFGGDTAVSMPSNIAPSQYVTVSANLIAPITAGTYTSYWMMKTDSGQFFGFGPAGKDPIHVTIQILDLGFNTNPTPTPTP
jgi:hypothetical protein